MVNRGTEKKGGEKEKRGGKSTAMGLKPVSNSLHTLLNHCNKVATQAVLSYFDVFLFFSQRVVQRCAACPLLRGQRGQNYCLCTVCENLLP